VAKMAEFRFRGHMQNLDVDEAKHDDKQYRKDGKDNNVLFTPIKYGF